MQTTSRRTDTKSRKESKDELTKKQDEKPKRSVYTISTSRDFVQKSTTADIYAQKKKINIPSAKAPKKAAGTSNVTDVSPMKGLLKSSASSVSQISEKTPAKRNEAKSSLYSARRNETPRKPTALTSVTVNSPSVKRKLNLNSERVSTNEMGSRKNERTNENLNLSSERVSNKESSSKNEKTIESKKSKEVTKENYVLGKAKESLKESAVVQAERQRTKTRTLDENEVKILKPDVVDNNASMMNLSQKLAAKPKAFYVDLDIEKPQSQPKKDKSSDEEISYEDDFESYESDFDSYHSERTDADESDESEKNEASEQSERNEEMQASAEESSLKEKDDEKMLDSGNFDLRDQRSGKSKPAVMDFIVEAGEDRKPVSLTDEGFQDMSSSSAASSMRTQQAERPLFIDFSKSKQNKLKRKIHERLQQRAKDLLEMINLHEMYYSLFEMPPISYDLYMATFGRSNYTQIGVQTFDDGITEEVQTDEVAVSQKWTQYPVEFSKNDIHYNNNNMARKYSNHTEDYLTIFTILIKGSSHEHNIDSNISDEKYLDNPLRIFLEQKDGVGEDEILPYKTYKSKLKSNDYNLNKLGKFLKKFESKISYALNSNVSDKDVTNLTKSNKIPFSKGYVSLSNKTMNEEKMSLVKSSKISRVIFSETKANLIFTVHKNAQNVHGKKSLICLWDLSVARTDPVKVLTAIDDVLIGRFRGNIDGVFVAALDDGSIHLWDLTEEPTWRDGVASENKPTQLVDIDSERLTEFEKDREWNLKNSHVGFDQARVAMALQSCAFTSSAGNMTTKEEIDRIVGLEINTDTGSLEAGRRIVGQISSLQRIGVLTIWSIIHEKMRSCKDMGKAFLSKMKLEKKQTINLTDHIDISTRHNISNDHKASFNLNAAKRRLSLRKKEKCIVRNQSSRPQSAISSQYGFDIDRPSSAASMRKRVLPVEINVPKNWETGVVCNDLKIMRINNIDSYLVAKNCGEVLCCKRCLGAVKVERFTVASDTSSVTNVVVSSKGIPYFLAATDTGTVNLCSLLDNRVLLTLDCRNVPLSQDKCISDSKGRFIRSVTSRRSSGIIETPLAKLEIKSAHWSPVNPCCIYVLLQDCTVVLFELTHSDIYAKYVCENAAVEFAANDFNLALLTPEGEVQVHRLANELQTKENLNIFEKYVALL